MTVKTLSLEHLPSDKPVHVALFRDVCNSTFLKQQLLAGNADFEYAFIDASVIVSTVHALAAVFRAMNDSFHERLRSRNVHSEIVFSLSPNNNIAESFRRFGIDENTTSLLVVKVSTAPSITHESVQQHLSAVVEGTALEFSDENLCTLTDLAKVRKLYKLNSVSSKQAGVANTKTGDRKEERKANGVSHPDANEFKEVEAAILGAIALRGAS
ncbi:MAG: hypothetical protein M1837_004650 [Sclerophora amabilis]|nr:MAG: hypothetical protein M1837_004650 [Sclerophora amabilis]